jgi:hypothetical protein
MHGAHLVQESLEPPNFDADIGSLNGADWGTVFPWAVRPGRSEVGQRDLGSYLVVLLNAVLTAPRPHYVVLRPPRTVHLYARLW